ncbi:MAG: phage tail protein [Gemmatimonas sp.]
MQLSITHNFPQVAASLNALPLEIRNQVMGRALNRAVDKAKTQMIRQITGEYKVLASYVRPRLTVVRARFAGGRVFLQAELRGGDGKRRSANVIAFLERSVSFAEAKRRAKKGTLNQLGFKFKRAGGVKHIPGAFIANKGRTVFRRVPGTTMASRSKYAGTKHAEGIEPVRVIGVPSMFNTRKINSAVIRSIEAELPLLFERESRFALGKFNAR